MVKYLKCELCWGKGCYRCDNTGKIPINDKSKGKTDDFKKKDKK